MYHEYLASHSEEHVSYGSFIALKPFHVRSATQNDIEMCCCKLHLHARWSISALIECAKKQGIQIDFDTYDTFFNYLTKDCQSSESTYIDWVCTPNKKSTCDHIQGKWEGIKSGVISIADEDVTVKLMHFESVETTTKKGAIVKRLRALSTDANVEFILDFISNLLPKIINHRNQLKHYRHSIKTFHDLFDALNTDIDFSENLLVPVKYEPQSLHWSHKQVTIHSGILKLNGEKSYHPYISEDRQHDQSFVKIVIEEMLNTVDKNLPGICAIESDNCSAQYKSAQHVYDIQQISNKYKMSILRVFSIAGHGKGEVDHVGGGGGWQ